MSEATKAIYAMLDAMTPHVPRPVVVESCPYCMGCGWRVSETFADCDYRAVTNRCAYCAGSGQITREAQS